MTSRDLRNKWRPYGVSIEYLGYKHFYDGSEYVGASRVWRVYDTKYGYATLCWSLEQVDLEAKYICCMISDDDQKDRLELIRKWQHF